MPVQAQAHCWADREVSAAQLRKLQTMLMVATLRCRAAHIDISADYDSFVGAQKDTITRANLLIKQHFAADGGSQADYDRFATSLANGFGDNETSEGSCAEAAMLAHEASMASPASLEPLALGRVFPVTLPGGNCAAPAAPVVAAGPVVPARAVAVAAALPVVQPAPAPIVPIDANADEAPAVPAPVAVAVASAPPPQPKAEPAMLPAEVLAAMAVMARYQATLAPAAAPAVIASTQP